MSEPILSLREALKRASLDYLPESFIGRKFEFSAMHGSHQYALAGSITSLSWSDESGLKMFVSIPEIWGVELLCLIYTESGWAALTKSDDIELLTELARLPDGVSERMADEIIEKHFKRRFLPGVLTLL